MEENIIYDAPDMQVASIVGEDTTTLAHHRPGSDKGQGGDTGITIPGDDFDF